MQVWPFHNILMSSIGSLPSLSTSVPNKRADNPWMFQHNYIVHGVVNPKVSFLNFQNNLT